MKLLASLLAVLAAFAGCGDDGAAPRATACDGCRTVASGNAFQDGDTAIGVGRCDTTSCRLTIANPDGTETDLDVAAGDDVDAGSGWTVVATGADGLTVRPAP